MCPRSSFAATVANGNIYCMGGFSGNVILNSVERFNPVNEKWHCVSSMKFRRFGHLAGTITVAKDRLESETMALRRKELDSKRKDSYKESDSAFDCC